MFPTAIPASTLRQNLKSLFDKLCSERAPFLITRKGKEDIVMMPADEYRGWEETLHLMKSPKNAYMLNKSLEQSKNNEVIYHDLIEV